MTHGHTPTQAARLWCPMVRAYEGGSIEAGRGGQCRGPQCAMWRWDVVYVPPFDAEPGKLVAGVPVRAGTGYCGLAGTPAV